MKKIILVLLSLVSTLAVAQNELAIPESTVSSEVRQSITKIQDIGATVDDKLIITVVERYVKGLRLGSVDLLKSTFHKDGIMFGYCLNGKIREGSVQSLYDSIGKNGPLSMVTANISVMHKTSNTAFVLAELQTTATDQNSTDYLSLMKINGEWKIISKVYHLYSN